MTAYIGKHSGTGGLWCFLFLVILSFWARVTLTPKSKVNMTHCQKLKVHHVHMSSAAHCITTKPHQHQWAAQEGEEAVDWTNASPIPDSPALEVPSGSFAKQRPGSEDKYQQQEHTGSLTSGDWTHGNKGPPKAPLWLSGVWTSLSSPSPVELSSPHFHPLSKHLVPSCYTSC